MEREHLARLMEVIYHRCCRILRDPEAARDALQEIFTSFYERRREVVIDKPLHYLYRSSTHHCLNLLRAKKRRLAFDPSHEESFAPSPEAGLLVEQLHDAFGEEALQMMVYRYVDQMTYDEIGQIFDRSDRAIKKRLDRLQENLQQYLKT